MDALTVFKLVTYDLHELTSSIEIRYNNAVVDEIHSTELKPKTVSSAHYGRCYELSLYYKDLDYYSIFPRRNLEVYLNFPSQFYANEKARFFVKSTEKMSLHLIYEIIKFNYDKTCRKYSLESYEGSFDQCKMSDIEQRIKSKFNCTVPFFIKQGNFCLGTDAEKAMEMFQDDFRARSLKCPRSCYEVVPIFGVPKRGHINKTRRTRLYLKSHIKVTEDFVSYGLLR